MKKILNWLISQKKYIIIIVAFISLIAITYISGCQRGKKLKQCPQITSETVYIHDTVTHFIYDIYPAYIEGKEKIIYIDVPAKVDTALILKEYFAQHIFNRKWQDSLLAVNLVDTISQNKPVGNLFSYKILRPQTIVTNTIDNSVHYTKYLTFGLDLPISNFNFIELEGTYNFNKGYIGLGWTPKLNIKKINIRMGINILKIKR
jgi:hypothetical protein